MSTQAENLSKEKIKQLLTAVGSVRQEDTSGIETEEYNWNQPRFFDRKQLNRLDGFAKRVAKTINSKFVDFFHGDFEVNVSSITQHFAAEIIGQVIESGYNDYYLDFGCNHEYSCGLISLPAKTALIWATQLLGGSDSEVEGSDRDLTHLEESLVCDLLAALMKAFTQDSLDFRPEKNVITRLFQLELDGSEEMCKITFDIKKADRDKADEVYILILSHKLLPVVGRAEKTVTDFPPEDVSKAILARMQQMPVFITAQLASLVLTLREIMILEVGDILLLDKKVNEPVELVINGRTSLLGRPAKSAGKFAVVVTELCNDTG
jgi:flagellar motor switch protein FliM